MNIPSFCVTLRLITFQETSAPKIFRLKGEQVTTTRGSSKICHIYSQPIVPFQETNRSEVSLQVMQGAQNKAKLTKQDSLRAIINLKDQVLNEEEIKMIFYSKLIDQNIKFNDDQMSRFKRYIYQNS